MSNDKPIDASLLQAFVVETTEHLDQTDTLLATLGDYVDQKPVLNMIFRRIHSVKGGALSIGLGNIGKIAHGIESLLVLAQRGLISPDKKFVVAILNAVALIRSFLQLSKRGYGEELDVSSDYAKLLDVSAHLAKTAKSVEISPDISYEIFFDHYFLVEPEQTQVFQSKSDKETVAEPLQSSQILEAAIDFSMHGESQTDVPSTARVNVDKIDEIAALVGSLSTVYEQVDKLSSFSGKGMAQKLRGMQKTTKKIQARLELLRKLPFRVMAPRMKQLVDELEKRLGKKLKLKLQGVSCLIDVEILEGLGDPLTHLVRNSCDHGIESPESRLKAGKLEFGTICLSASLNQEFFEVSVKDDGRGMNVTLLKEKILKKKLKTIEELSNMADEQVIHFLFDPGVSTVESVSAFSGRGFGLDIVKTKIISLGGGIKIWTQVGKGSKITMKIPR